MRLVRFRPEKGEKGSIYGILHGEEILEIGEGRKERTFRIEDVTLLPPSTPSKIVAVGLNYRDHAEEMGKPIPEEPLIFIKPSSAVIGPGDEIVYPRASKRVDYEAELALVVGKRARRVSPEEAGDYILGYTCFNDVTARDLQRKDVQYTRAKGFDTFAPMGPWIETEIDPSDLLVESYVNGERRQSSSTANMIFDVYYLLSFVSHVMTLFPGDVIATGTPSGVGPVAVGDEVEIRIGGIGSLVNRIVAEENH